MISIVVPVKNDEYFLTKLFDDYASQSFQNFEIITVVDSMSIDSSIDICHEFADGAYVMEGNKVGRDMSTCALMRNYGASQSTGDILIHTDCDISFQDGSQLGRIVSYFVDNNLDIASSRRVIGKGGVLKTNWIGELAREFCSITQVPIVIKKELFNRLGGFPLCRLHDIKLDSAVRACGFKPVLIPEWTFHKRRFNGVV